MLMLWNIIKETSIGSMAVLIGWLSTNVYTIAFFQASDVIASPSWYEHPAFTSALITSIILFAIKYYDRREARQGKQGQKNQDYSDKLAEITERGWQEYLKQSKQLEAEKESFAQAEIMKLETDSYRDRLIKHACFNEIQRLQGHIRDQDVVIAKCDPKLVSEFMFKYQSDIVEGIDDQVKEYRQTLRKNLVTAIEANKETKNDIP